MADLIEQMDSTVKEIYDRGVNMMKQSVIDTFEETLEIKPDISARDLYELMKRHEVLW